MSDFIRTMDLLAAAGIPLRMVDPATVTYWIDEKGYSPERVAEEIFGVRPPVKGRAS